LKKKIAAVLTTLAIAVGIVLAAGTPASATVYFNCPSGVGCVWKDKDGGGIKLVISVGTFGTNTCWNFAPTNNDITSSASADYGSGWDLKLYQDVNCDEGSPYNYGLHSSHFVNFTGSNFAYNDIMSSFKIVQLPN